MVVSPEGRFFTGREHPRLVLVRARLGAEGLLLDASGLPPLAVACAGPDGGRVPKPVTVWSDDTHGGRCRRRGGGLVRRPAGDPGPPCGDDRRLPSPRRSRRRAAGRPRELRGRLPGARHRARLPRRAERTARRADHHAPLSPQPRGRGCPSVRGGPLVAAPDRRGGVRGGGELRAVRIPDHRPGHRGEGHEARAHAHPRHLPPAARRGACSSARTSSPAPSGWSGSATRSRS